jgi:hypothetical protein
MAASWRKAFRRPVVSCAPCPDDRDTHERKIAEATAARGEAAAAADEAQSLAARLIKVAHVLRPYQDKNHFSELVEATIRADARAVRHVPKGG